MSENNPSLLELIVGFSVVAYFVISVLCFFEGVDRKRSDPIEICGFNTVYDLVLPGRSLGCYFGDLLNKKI